MVDVLADAGRRTKSPFSAPLLKRPVTVVPVLIKVFGQKHGCWREVALRCERALKCLVHRTHMSSCRVDKPSEIVDVGDKVWVKLIRKEMKDDKLKLSLSMKVVNQGTGKDLDPNNVSLDQDERKKRTFRDYTSQKITLEAVLNTVCKKCGCKGHFAKECFVQPGGTKYSLIPEEEEDEVAAAGYERDKKTSLADDSSKKRKKEKKKKKKHKNKQFSESDSDSDGAQPASKRSKHSGKPSKAQKKKKKKHKKEPWD
ncbi:zinc finger CCHC domain-containing protein 17 isoform X1 [Falco biarmicus]|uniref:nucleolar protein of 40 kDa isoform X1 n=1 Tax=Falco rusticolus TaxID=120794 RepID=UPI000FFB10D0|nr:nucleolar protein of 40 kDa isoform X1 [Falco rusticolus]XP_055561162.1 zinc finger CCHC domain-containing protein 17 isoform X1 [Falco cherrug]XP_055655780.1 zinc finger CCHC domain-containing protein 17 isoform X1 [Falco peregrinus]XP_056187977.1 zinc finger CCHC domain-containing protein 17 isoform X1 [Falco biarmicus]XP_056187978.1 zinc finger CCHC domain-containing protein 17 isoform X1 [Falco biarmicus]